MTDGGTGEDDRLPGPAPVVAGSVGILGGTFDPIHHGHLAIAEEVRESLGLERILVVPVAEPAHKPGAAVGPAGDRLAMVRLAVAGNPALEASDLEVARGGRSYTVDTLEALRATGVARPWLVLSTEALAGFPAWRSPERILELARLAVVPRAGAPALDEAWLRARLPAALGRCVFVPGPHLAISGSVIRRRVAVGRSIRYLVPDAVAAYVAEHGLYRDPNRRKTAT